MCLDPHHYLIPSFHPKREGKDFLPLFSLFLFLTSLHPLFRLHPVSFHRITNFSLIFFLFAASFSFLSVISFPLSLSSPILFPIVEVKEKRKKEEKILFCPFFFFFLFCCPFEASVIPRREEDQKSSFSPNSLFSRFISFPLFLSFPPFSLGESLSSLFLFPSFVTLALYPSILGERLLLLATIFGPPKESERESDQTMSNDRE